jgi:hypothetical protein
MFLAVPSKCQVILLITIGTGILCWPAFFNGMPLLYSDSMAYIGEGNYVARALFLRETWSYYGHRSFIYGLGILPFHLKDNLWPVVVLQGILTGYVLWLVIRSFHFRLPFVSWSAVIIVLSTSTCLAWFVSFIMPDILGPLLYLLIYLIMFRWNSLPRTERAIVFIIGAWCAASHSTHLLIGMGACVVAVVVMVLKHQPLIQVARALAWATAVLVAAGAANILVHASLYGEPSLTGHRLPYLMARVIADGPGRWWLEKHCPDPEVRLAICDAVNALPQNSDQFLWAPNGIWQNADKKRLLEDEMTVVLGAVWEYPLAELEISMHHMWRQLFTFDLWNFYPDPYILKVLQDVLPETSTRYQHSRQFKINLHENLFSSIQAYTVGLSLIILVGLGGLIRSEDWNRSLIGLAAIILFVIPANAAVTGVLSTVSHRFQSRVIWLLPLLACLVSLVWAEGRHNPRKRSS